MNPVEPNILDQYAHSAWALWSSLVILIGAALYTYDRYAKRWSVITGVHQRDAKVVFSEICIDGHSRKQAVVVYAYSVNGRQYKGQLKPPKARLAEFIEQMPVGTEIPVYFAEREPAFSTPYIPPTNLTLIKRTIAGCFAFPFMCLHVGSLTLFAMLSQA
jgi:hypothetical protein